MKEQDQFILDIKRMGINGEGIGFYNKLAVFVPNAIPGEGHNVEVTKVTGKMAFAKSLEIKHRTDTRKTPECPYYDECGGCSTMHIKYDEILKLKRDLVIESIQRYTKLNPRSFEIKQTLASINEFNYRNKSQLLIRNFGGKSTVCMTKENSNILVPIEKCLVQDEVINNINKGITEIADKMELDYYNLKNNKGFLRYIVVRVNQKKEALVTIVFGQKSDKLKDFAIEISKLEHVKGVYETKNTSDKPNIIFGPKINLVTGEAFIIEQIGNIKYKLYPSTFFQLNTVQAKNMFDIVLKNCKLSFKERVLDAYCGVGAISLYLAKMAKEVVGIEYVKESVEAANENAKLNKIKNARFLQGDAKELLPKLLADEEAFDVLVVDPPRVGLDKEFINAILNSGIKRVIYVSCNPATLAKNLEDLSVKYQVNSITPLDMFPNTAHVESIALMVLRDDSKHVTKK